MSQKIEYRLISLAISFSAVFFPTIAEAAERIAFNLNPFGQFQIEIEDLNTFVATGERTAELNYYLKRLSPEQLVKLPELLSTPLEFNSLTVAKFTNSTVGEVTMVNLGKGIRPSPTRNGLYALRGAIIAAAFDDEGLTLINVLQHYPSKTVHLDLEVLTKYLERTVEIAQNRQQIERTWFGADRIEPNSDRLLPPSNVPQALGQYSWRKQTLTYQNPQRRQPGLFDLYQPERGQNPPLIAISHGLASNRQTFAYLGEHLASHGFAVAIIEHDELSLDKFDRILAGTAPFPQAENLIDRPLDISSVLDRLESESNIDLQQVGIIGQSFGGYGALALSGGTLNKSDAPVCQPENYRDVLLDLSSLAQCAFNQLDLSQVKLRDSRVKAVIAINPMAKIFGSGISSVQTPTMIISGINDLIMPPVTEQIKPFTKLDDDFDNYLVLVKPGTHFSFLKEGLGVLPVPDTVVGPRPVHAYPLLKTLATAFFQVYLTQQLEYQAYLETDLTQLSNNAFDLAIIRSLDEMELGVFEGKRKQKTENIEQKKEK